MTDTDIIIAVLASIATALLLGYTAVLLGYGLAKLVIGRRNP